MRCKRNVYTFIILAGIVLLAGTVSLFFKSHSHTIKNGTLDLSSCNGTQAIALVEEAGLEYHRIHVTGTNPGETLALRIPPYLSANRIYIDGKPSAPCNEREATEDCPKLHCEVETYEFVPAHESFDLAIQTAKFGAPLFGTHYVIYIGTDGQIDRINSTAIGYDIFILAFLFVVISYNIFYFCLRKDLFFVIFILLCSMMAGKTLINGSFLLGSLFPNVMAQTAMHLEFVTMLFLPACWLSITYFSNVVSLPKTVVKASYLYAAAVLLASFAVSASALTWLYLLAEFVWLAAAGYVVLKSLEAVIVRQLSRPVTFLLLSGIVIPTFCSVLNLFQYLFGSKGLLDFLPIGFILYALLWDYSYTYQYDVLLKDRLKVLEDLNAAHEQGRSLELKFLRSQIRPHFINNVLNSIIAVSLTDPERSRELLCYFSTYLKSCYDFAEPYNSVTIEYELSVVKAFLELEKARFTDFLHVEYCIDDLSIDIPPLILQPLVENAVKHNKISQKSPLSICIYVIKKEGAVKIGVGDNGCGFQPETIPSLLNGKINSQGVGIYNVNMRLEKIYGTTLKIENREGGGCDVYMLLPDTNMSAPPLCP